MGSVFRLSQRSSDGKATLREEFEVMSKMRGKLHEELDYPPMPHVFEPIIDSYKDLGSSDINYQEVLAYKAVTGITLDGFDISLIKDIDYIKRLTESGKTTAGVLEAFGYGKA